jgi:NAD(P)-dependent dehydrogenase (short-subunit alcohol dehydrogenase family)
MESLAPEVAPFGIRTMAVEPGFFRTDLLTPGVDSYAESTIDDYSERSKQTVEARNGMNGRQGGDPAKLAAALISLATSEAPPVRWGAGADAVAGVSRRPTTCWLRSTPIVSCRARGRCRLTGTAAGERPRK